MQTGGNVYYNGARPYFQETSSLLANIDPQVRIIEDGDVVFLQISFGPELKQASTKLITTRLFRKAIVPKQAFENPDGSPLVIGTNYFGRKRNAARPTPGPFATPGQEELRLKLGKVDRLAGE